MYRITVFDGKNTGTYIINAKCVYAINAEADKLHYKVFGKHGIKFVAVELK